MNIVILHAYSASNSGDGLLVDLAIEVVQRNFGSKCNITVVASDPESFNYLPQPKFPAPIMAAKPLNKILDAVFVNRSYAPLSKLLEKADLIVGVGGGYMRSKTNIERLKLNLGHGKQLETGIKSKAPIIYLPQSIGPFHGNHENIIKHYSAANAVFARDDRSKKIFSTVNTVHRSPDLAVQALAKKVLANHAFIESKSTPETICLVLRKPPAWDDQKKAKYKENLQELIKKLSPKSKIIYAVQSSVRGNNDELFYKELGITESLLSLKETLSKFNPDLVISVRLHGAIESLISGFPAFHISYERKGFGAYEDMGVSDWVVNGANFDTDYVIKTIFKPGALQEFKDKVISSCKDIEKHTLKMDEIIKGIVR
jgi:polysaccharide pyruvyl transferase WcaK-like protein